ncbi:MAG: class I SAM-dependent methyltransferase [Nitrospirales bacterium]|nr:class I SAM-dependent methyltransferase [Nitrospirales bacterium]
MQKHIFPESNLEPVGKHICEAERAGLDNRDVENIREHYALTLRLWLRRFEANQNSVEQLTNEIIYRKFRIYLAASAYDFQSSRLKPFQTLYLKPEGASDLPLTRDAWYSEKQSLLRKPESSAVSGLLDSTYQ